jgi:hypothetical protein
MATARRPSRLSAWTDRILRRPREITPFTLEPGAQMVGDPTSPEGARVQGGGVQFQPGWVVNVRDGGSRAVFRAGVGYPVAGEVYCDCPGKEGESCSLLVSGQKVTCGGDACCQLSYVARDPSVRLSGITRSA